MFLLFLFPWIGLNIEGPDLRRVEILTTYAGLPSKGKQVKFNCEVFEKKDWKHEDNVIGVYWIGKQKAEFRNDLPKDEFANVFGHEFSHHVYFAVMRTEDIVDWNNWWKEHEGLMPRWYAKTSASEGWAECYSVRYVGKAPVGLGYPENYVLDPEVKAKVEELMAKPSKVYEPKTLAELVCKTR